MESTYERPLVRSHHARSLHHLKKETNLKLMTQHSFREEWDHDLPVYEWSISPYCQYRSFWYCSAWHITLKLLCPARGLGMDILDQIKYTQHKKWALCYPYLHWAKYPELRTSTSSSMTGCIHHSMRAQAKRAPWQSSAYQREAIT